MNNLKTKIMKNNNKSEMLIAIITGVTIGLGIGMLFAPDKGSKTRKKIKDSAVDTTKDVSHWLTNAKEELVHTAQDHKEAFDEKVKNSMAYMSNKAEDILTEMEHKLERLRKMNS